MLGFAIAVQVHANSQSDSLSSLREDDLIGILDNQNARADRLRQQIADLQSTLQQLQDSGDRPAAAPAAGRAGGERPRHPARARCRRPGPAWAGHRDRSQPGASQPEDLLDVVEELRGAGAEAIQFGSVRV